MQDTYEKDCNHSRGMIRYCLSYENGEYLMSEEKITKRNLIMFPLGTVGRDMMYNLVTSYLLTFVLFTHKLTAAQLSAITAIMVTARISTR